MLIYIVAMIVCMIIAFVDICMLIAAAAADAAMSEIWKYYEKGKDTDDRIQIIQTEKEISGSAVSPVCDDRRAGTNACMDSCEGRRKD